MSVVSQADLIDHLLMRRGKGNVRDGRDLLRRADQPLALAKIEEQPLHRERRDRSVKRGIVARMGAGRRQVVLPV